MPGGQCRDDLGERARSDTEPGGERVDVAAGHVLPELLVGDRDHRLRGGGFLFVPETLVLEGIGRQVGDLAAGDQREPVDRTAADRVLRHRGREPGQAALVAAQRADDRAGVPGFVQRLLDAHRQHRMRADLDEPGVAGFGELRDDRGEADRAPQVREPVRGVHRGLFDCVQSDRRGHCHVAAARFDRAEVGEQPVREVLDVRRVRRVVHRDQLRPEAFRHQLVAQLFQGFGVAGQHGGRRAVVRRDRDPAVPRTESLFQFGRREARGEHAAAASTENVTDRLAPQGNDQRTVLK